MKPVGLFRQFLTKDVMQLLELQGFSRSGYTFTNLQPESIGIVDFQKSNSSTAESFRFTINLGVASRRLLSFFSPTSQKLDIWDCHWRIRPGSSSDQHRELWWSIADEESLQQVRLEVATYINGSAMAQMRQLMTDAGLKNLWLSRQSPSLTNFERLRNLLVLLKALGPEEQFNSVAEEFLTYSEGRPVEVTAKLHLERLREEKLS